MIDEPDARIQSFSSPARRRRNVLSPERARARAEPGADAGSGRERCARARRAQGDHRAARGLHLFRADRGQRLRAARAGARADQARGAARADPSRRGARAGAAGRWRRSRHRSAPWRSTAPRSRHCADCRRSSRAPQAHALEHSLEVHVPFLQTMLGDFTLVPLAVGHATQQEVAEVLERLWGGPETLIVVSSDLSHYLPYADAQAVDRATAKAILALATDISHEQACGATPVTGLTLAARRRGLKPELLDLRNSGDTAGDRDRVVGYGSFAFYEAGRGMNPIVLTSNYGLRRAARRAPRRCRGTPGRCCCRSRAPRSRASWASPRTRARRPAVAEAAGRVLRHPHAGRASCAAASARCARTARSGRTSAATRSPPRSAIRASSRSPPRSSTRIVARDLGALARSSRSLSPTSRTRCAQLRPGIDGVVFEYGHHSQHLSAAGLGKLQGPRRISRAPEAQGGAAARFLGPRREAHALHGAEVARTASVR